MSVIHEQAAALMGELPAGVEVVVADPEASDGVDVSGVDLWVPQFLSGGPVPAVLARMPKLKVIQLITAGADTWVGRVPEPITLCDGRGIHSVADVRVDGDRDPQLSARVPAFRPGAGARRVVAVASPTRCTASGCSSSAPATSVRRSRPG